MSTTTYRAVKVQLHTPVEGQPYKSISWHWRVETSPLGTYLTGEDGKPLEFDTKAAAEVAAFDADPHAWTDENGMRYRCKRCHEPMLSILPTELTSGVCRCGGLIEADPRNFADIDPALYGLPQDSEIGPEVYPERGRPAPGWPEILPDGVLIQSGLLTASPAGWDVAEPGPEQQRLPDFDSDPGAWWRHWASRATDQQLASQRASLFENMANDLKASRPVCEAAKAGLDALDEEIDRRSDRKPRETLAAFRAFAHATYGPNRDGWPRVTRQIEDQLVGKAFAEVDPLREARS